MEADVKFMRRALQLASYGRGHVSPNPMVGAVIAAPDGRIIGEGWHRRYGSAHAEVNAFASVKADDECLIPESTIYVSLEPCSHYGKTPPCAELLISKGIARCVAAATDPNPKVSGRGLDMLRAAGIEVHTGVLEAEAKALNKTFFTAHTLHRPFVTLKWAQSADGFIDGHFSGALARQICHNRRAQADAIIVGAGTALVDNPSLNVRDISGRSPRRVVLDRHGLVDDRMPDALHYSDGRSIASLLASLYAEHGITSVLVEGGAGVLTGFIESGLWDEAYVEVSPERIHGKIKAPSTGCAPVRCTPAEANLIFEYVNLCPVP